MQKINFKSGKVTQLVSRALIASTILIVPMTATADGNRSKDFLDRVKLTGFISQGAQALEADDGAFNALDSEMDPGFNFIRYALGFNIQLTDNISAFVELSEEPNDFGVDYTPHVDFAIVTANLDKNHTVQIGTNLNALFNFRGYSDGAVVQSNPLIGNSPADMVTAAEGIAFAGTYEKFHWDFTVSSGSFGESFQKDRGFTYILRSTYNVNSQFSLGLGASISGHGDQVRNGTTAPVSSAMYRGDGDTYRFLSAGNGPIRNTHAGLIPGLDTSAIHLDAQYATETMTFRGWYGMVRDDFSYVDVNGEQTVANQSVGFSEFDSEMSFVGVEGTYYITPKKFYLAGRYVTISNDSNGISSQDTMTRLQLGLGYKYTDNVLFKVEYVNQTEEVNSAGQIGADWDGIVMEASYSF